MGQGPKPIKKLTQTAIVANIRYYRTWTATDKIVDRIVGGPVAIESYYNKVLQWVNGWDLFAGHPLSLDDLRNPKPITIGNLADNIGNTFQRKGLGTYK